MIKSEARLAWRLFHLNWLPIVIMGSVLLIAVLFSGFSIAPATFFAVSGLSIELALIAYLYVRLRRELADPKLVFALGGIAQLVMLVVITGPLSYVALTAGWPLQDQTLLAIDRTLGLDPKVVATFVNARPWLAASLDTGYTFIKLFLLAIPIILAATMRLVRLQVFVGAMSIALAVTLAISAFTPAIGTYYGLNVPVSDFPSLNPFFYTAQLHDILAVRAASLRHLELFNLAGVVSFPSFHAASAILYMWALWPVRGLGAVAAATNILMILATPVIGAHYMIDVIGGGVVAVAAIWAAKHCRDLVTREAARSSRTLPQPQISLQPY
jgi:membrane-associated phospholipid phosphatase